MVYNAVGAVASVVTINGMACLQNCFLQKKDWNAPGAYRKWDKDEVGIGALQSVQLILQRTFHCLGVNFLPAIDSIGKHIFEKSPKLGCID